MDFLIFILNFKFKFCRNWKGLAHVLGFQEVHVYCWSHESNPASRVIKEWLNRDGKKATVSKLIDLYVQLGRCDFMLGDVAKLLSKSLSNFSKIFTNKVFEVSILPQEEPMIFDKIVNEELKIVLCAFLVTRSGSFRKPRNFNKIVLYELALNW